MHIPGITPFTALERDATDAPWLDSQYARLHYNAVQELAVALVRVKFEDPAQWQHMIPYWHSLPERSALYGKYTFNPEHASLLQDESLVRARFTGHLCIHNPL